MRPRCCRITGFPMVAAWGFGGVGALLFAAFLGGAILHLRGHYFAIASLIVAEMLREIVNTTPDLTGGGMGLNLPILRISISAQAQLFFFAMLILAVLATATAIVLQQSKLGFGLRCIQQNEDAASILGVNAYGYKTAAFVLSAVYAGVAGAIYASWVNYIEPPDVFDILLAVKPLVMVLLGGVSHDFRSAHRRCGPAHFGGGGVAQFPHHPRRRTWCHHRRFGAVPAERPAFARPPARGPNRSAAMTALLVLDQASRSLPRSQGSRPRQHHDQ